MHVDRAQPEDNRGGCLRPSPGDPEYVTGRGVGVGWHVGCHVSGVVDLGKQRSSHHIGVAQLPIVSECFWEEFKAGRIEKAHEDSGQVGGQISVCLSEGRGRLTSRMRVVEQVLSEVTVFGRIVGKR